jgi:TusA-related sulfurtransferase
MQTETAPQLNTTDLEQKVKNMYREVALHPNEKYHFEIGRSLAEQLGYDPKQLDQIPQEAIESFAGVGFFFDYAAIKEGDKVLDLGSGSGMDSFLAALKVGKTGSVTGLDMTDEQLQKAEGLCPDKSKVFKEISRILKPGGRLAIADIVSEKNLPDNVVCDATLWASCIGGASQEGEYSTAIKSGGLNIVTVITNESYAFISSSAQSASKKYGVKSISLLAEKRIVADVHLFVPGLACANLTPAIKKEMQNLQAGQILEVISDDFASREGVPAWCRLTGNKLLSEIDESEDKTIFYIQKKN